MVYCLRLDPNTTQKRKFSIKDFFSKCDRIRSFLRIWSHLLKKFLMESFIFCAVKYWRSAVIGWQEILFVVNSWQDAGAYGFNQEIFTAIPLQGHQFYGCGQLYKFWNRNRNHRNRNDLSTNVVSVVCNKTNVFFLAVS